MIDLIFFSFSASPVQVAMHYVAQSLPFVFFLSSGDSNPVGLFSTELLSFFSLSFVMQLQFFHTFRASRCFVRVSCLRQTVLESFRPSTGSLFSATGNAGFGFRINHWHQILPLPS